MFISLSTTPMPADTMSHIPPDGSFVFADASLLPGGETELYPVPYSDCIVTSGNSPALFRLGSALECCDLTQYGIEHELLAQCFMPNIGWNIAVSIVESQFEFNLISPVRA